MTVIQKQREDIKSQKRYCVLHCDQNKDDKKERRQHDSRFSLWPGIEATICLSISCESIWCSEFAGGSQNILQRLPVTQRKYLKMKLETVYNSSNIKLSDEFTKS